MDFSIKYSQQVFRVPITCLKFDYQTRYLLVGGLNSKIYIYAYDTKPVKLHTISDSGNIIDFFWSHKYEVLISMCGNGNLSLWNQKSLTLITK